MSISGVVVALNEERHLAQCLKALDFCDELVLIDLESIDRSPEIGVECGARIVSHPPVPAVESVRQFGVDQASGDWIVFMDPDMVFPRAVVPAVLEATEARTDVGVIYVHYRNFFHGRPVRYGRWGGLVGYPAVFKREAMELLPFAHRGFRLRPNYRAVTLGQGDAEMIVHHWIESGEDLRRRIARYAPLEGEARFAAGERFRFTEVLLGAPLSFVKSYVFQRGYLDGWRGLYLSWLSAKLTVIFALSLRSRQRHARA